MKEVQVCIKWSYLLFFFHLNFYCLDYLDILQQNLSAYNSKFKNTKLNDFSWLGIPEILINIMSYHDF